MQWMIYGANGYSAQLIAKAAVDAGHAPVLAGRNRQAIQSFAAQLDLSCLIFDLSDISAVDHALQDIDIVLNCAGPFSQTASLMVAACLKNQCHYLDITGEIEVFEWVGKQHQQAQEKDVVLCPGVGFDVIPTDCLAAQLHAKLPDATELSLAFVTSSGMSPGTAKTTVESLKIGGMRRENGEIIVIPFARYVRQITVQRKERSIVSIPWGDISTAFASTRIPNITCYTGIPKNQIKWLKFCNKISWLLKTSWLQKGLKSWIAKSVSGPTLTERDTAPTFLWGEVKNQQGRCVTGEYQTGNGYSVTVYGALAAIDYLLANKAAGGFYTPSKLIGHGFAESLPESTPIIFQSS